MVQRASYDGQAGEPARASLRRRARVACWLCVLSAALAAGCGDDAASLTTLPAPRDGSEPTTRDGGARDTRARGSDPERTASACNQVELTFTARTPRVTILVDRSSSMFEQGSWNPLKAGVLETVARLERDVHFGFAAYTGERGGTCPELSGVVRSGGGLAEIQRAYDALSAPRFKGETPTARALAETAAQLALSAAAPDVETGPAFILLVTDGEPDFCDDGNVVCARDAVVAAAQDAHRQGVGTLVFHVGGQVDRQHLEDVARAGSGEPVADRGGAVAAQCGTPRATYTSAGGEGVLFEPDVHDRGALVGALSQAIAGLRGCTFDLRGDDVRIDPAAAGQGSVTIDGVPVPHDPVDGYRLNAPSELELRGAACEALRRPDARRVRIDFPCAAVIVI